MDTHLKFLAEVMDKRLKSIVRSVGQTVKRAESKWLKYCR